MVQASSSSSITMGCSASALVASEEVAGPETGRGRSKGAAILGIGANGQVLNVFRFSFWNLSRDNKGVACTGGNGDNLILSRINLLLLCKVPVELHQEVRVRLVPTTMPKVKRCLSMQ